MDTVNNADKLWKESTSLKVHVLVELYEINALFSGEYSFESMFGESVAVVGLWVVRE